MGLARIVRDLMRDRHLRKRFNENPNEIMGEYGVSDADRAVLLTMDNNQIAAKMPTHMQVEVQKFKIPDDEFRAVSEDFFVEDGGADPQYPSPAPGVFRFRPQTRSAVVLNAKPVGQRVFELVVFGQSLLDVDLNLVRADGAVCSRSNYSVFGTFRCSVLRAVFGPPGADVAWKGGDQYAVTILNNNTPPPWTVKPGFVMGT